MDKSGASFEDFVLGRHSTGGDSRKFFEPEKELDFESDVLRLLSKTSRKHPSTRIGKALFGAVKRELTKRGIKTHGFIFVPTVGAKMDVCYFTDALFYLPAIHQFPLTIDLFNIEIVELKRLKSAWVDSFNGIFYSHREFQSDLYRFNVGLFCWKREDFIAREEGLAIVKPKDLRVYKSCSRPQNHFILTPGYAMNYKGRREFAKMLVDYWASVANQTAFIQNGSTEP